MEISSSSSASRYLTAAFVATGIKKGVSYWPVRVVKIPVRALFDLEVILKGFIVNYLLPAFYFYL